MRAKRGSDRECFEITTLYTLVRKGFSDEEV